MIASENQWNVAAQDAARDELVNEVRAARYLDVSAKTLRNLRWKGGGPRFVKIGRLVRYRQSCLDAFIDQNSRQSTSNGGDNAR